MIVSYSALSELQCIYFPITRGDALRYAQRLPLAFILRAFGATRPRYFGCACLSGRVLDPNGSFGVADTEILI